MKNQAWNRFQNRTPHRTRTAYQIQNQNQRVLYLTLFVCFQDLHLQRPVTKGAPNSTAGAGL